MQMTRLQNVFVQAYDRMHALVQRNAKKSKKKLGQENERCACAEDSYDCTDRT